MKGVRRAVSCYQVDSRRWNCAKLSSLLALENHLIYFKQYQQDVVN